MNGLEELHAHMQALEKERERIAKHRKKWAGKKQKIGSIFLDTASVMVGDPCQMLATKSKKNMTYDGYMASAYKDDVLRIGGEIIAVSTGADGWCWVYLERDKQGNPFKLIIDLNTRFKE